MKNKFIFLICVLLIVLPIVYSKTFMMPDELLDPESFNLYLLRTDTYFNCYEKQGGNQLFILPNLNSRINNTLMLSNYCSSTSDLNNQCISSKEVITLIGGQTACDYSFNPKECNSCAESIIFKNEFKEKFEIVSLLLLIFLLPLLILYLLIEGIFYLIKKRIFWSKRLLIIIIILIVLLIIDLGWFIMHGWLFVQY